MPEVVPVETPAESFATDATSPEVASPAQTTPEFDEATWKKRLAGKDQALTATQRERDAVKAERDALAAWKAEQEQANMTELQKLQAERDRLATEAAQARAEALAIRLAARYPRAAEVLGDDLSKFEEARVAEIDGQLAKVQAEASDEPEPRVDPNSPGRRPAKSPSNPLEASREALVNAGNPFAKDDWR